MEIKIIKKYFGLIGSLFEWLPPDNQMNERTLFGEWPEKSDENNSKMVTVRLLSKLGNVVQVSFFPILIW